MIEKMAKYSINMLSKIKTIIYLSERNYFTFKPIVKLLNIYVIAVNFHKFRKSETRETETVFTNINL